MSKQTNMKLKVGSHAAALQAIPEDAVEDAARVLPLLQKQETRLEGKHCGPHQGLKVQIGSLFGSLWVWHHEDGEVALGSQYLLRLQEQAP